MYLVLVGGFSQPLRMAGWNPVNPAVWGNFRPMPLAIFYFATIFSATFFNVAFYHEVMRAFSGERPSLARGLRFSLSRVGPIASWTMFPWSVGMIMRLIGERFGWVARIVGVFAGFAWSVAAVFAIPVLARDGALDPMAVLRDSSTLVRRTWGGLVYGFASLAPFAFVFMLVSGVVVGVAGSAMGISPAGMTAASMVGALCFFVALAAIRDASIVAPCTFMPPRASYRTRFFSPTWTQWMENQEHVTANRSSFNGGCAAPAATARSPRMDAGFARKWATVSAWHFVMLVIVVGLFSIRSTDFSCLHRLRSLPVYEGAVSRVKEAPAAIAALGTPIKEGFLFSGTFSLDDTSNDARYRISDLCSQRRRCGSGQSVPIAWKMAL